MAVADFPSGHLPNEDRKKIECAENCLAIVKRCTTVPDLRKASQSVVIFGEGNFTFSVALAALRGGWDGITATRLEQVDHDYPAFSFPDVKLLNVKYIIENGKQLSDVADSIVDRTTTLLSLPPPPDTSVRYGIDATNTPNDLLVQSKVVWFQCPWTLISDDKDLAILVLIRNFITHMAGRQVSGEYLLIGINNNFQNPYNYHLQELLKIDDKNRLVSPHGDPYDFLGFDDELVKSILRHGYKHKCIEPTIDIHKQVVEHNMTLVFQRK